MEVCTLETITQLCESGEHTQRLRVVDGLVLQGDHDDASNKKRSIIFPLGTGFSSPTPESNYNLLFCCPDETSNLIASIRQLGEGNHAALTLGLSSVVLFQGENSEPLKSWSELKATSRYWEDVRVEKGVIVGKTRSPLQSHISAELDTKFNELVAQSRGATTRLAVSEVISNLERYMRSASEFAPSIKSHFEGIKKQIVEEAEQILKAEREIEAVGVSIQNGVIDVDAQARLAVAKASLDDSLDYLISISSALVYATSQTFSGTPPFGLNGGFIRSHSLLGTGVAWKAAFNIYLEIVEVFSRSQLLKKCKATLAHVTEPNSMDEGASTRRIVYFSTRHGFSEDAGVITFPTQSIYLCATPAWSLMTITHEVLHAHVRELMYATFAAKDEGSGAALNFESSLRCRIRELLEYIQHYGAKNLDFPKAPQSDQLRFRFLGYGFAFANAYDKVPTITFPEYRGSTRRQIEGVVPTDPERALSRFRDGFSFLEEVMVHTLDLMYFYGRDPDYYCHSIWHTWAALPRVLGRLDHYVLRTLVALASIQPKEKPCLERIRSAMKTLSDVAEQLLLRPESCTVAVELQRLLSEKKTRFTRFVTLLGDVALEFADFCIENFHCQSIDTALRERMGDLHDEDSKMDLCTNDASSLSPLAIVARQAMSVLGDDEMRPKSLELMCRESAFLLHSLASSNPKPP